MTVTENTVIEIAINPVHGWNYIAKTQNSNKVVALLWFDKVKMVPRIRKDDGNAVILSYGNVVGAVIDSEIFKNAVHIMVSHILYERNDGFTTLIDEDRWIPETNLNSVGGMYS